MKKRRISKYNEVSSIESEGSEARPAREMPNYDNDAGMVWRRLKRDVMRPPLKPYVFAILQGTGA